MFSLQCKKLKCKNEYEKASHVCDYKHKSYDIT